MKTPMFVAFFVLFTFVAFANEEPYLTKKFEPSNLKLVKVETNDGFIKIEGGAESEARVEVYIHANNNKSLTHTQIEEILRDDYTLTLTKEGSTLKCIAKKKSLDNLKNTLSISFKLFVPTKIDADLLTNGGKTAMKDLPGHGRKTSGGSISLVNVQGSIRARTSDGKIHTKVNNYLDLATSTGSLNVDIQQEESFKLNITDSNENSSKNLERK